MTETKHAPLPLRKRGYSMIANSIVIEPISEDSDVCIEVHGGTPEENIAYERHIVKACNAYPALVEALKEAHALCIGWAAFYQHDHNLPAFHPVHQGIIEKVTNALRAAGEEL